MDTKRLRPESLAAQALGWIDDKTRAITPPIHVSSTYLRDPDNQYRSGRIYARADNPAFDQAEALIATLEQGAQAALFASGMAAATAVFQALAPGDHVLAPKVMYWSLRHWLMNFATHWGLKVELIDMTDPAAVQAAIQPGKTRLVWVETPANPLWSITDIAATAQIAHAAGALLAVDSTVASPVLTRPIEHGADIVMHAGTKYLNGHSDLIAGVLVSARDDDFWKRVKTVRAQLGGTLGSFEAWLLLRGMRTLYLRVRCASQSAQRIAEHFATHPRVEAVLYPGLPGAPGHEIAARQMTGGFGGMLSLRTQGGADAAIATAANVRLWKRATSLGGTESLIEHRASVEGAGTPAPPDLLRLSVGIEDAGDLIADLEQALAAALPEGVAGMKLIDGIVADAATIGSLRRDVHAHPELRFEELRTAALVARKLTEWGIPMHQGMAQTGIIGIVHGRDSGAVPGKNGRAIGLRADMDAVSPGW